jgi:hypothetical protein
MYNTYNNFFSHELENILNYPETQWYGPFN